MKRAIIILSIILAIIAFPIVIKAIWIAHATKDIESFDSEKIDILQRRNYLLAHINTSPSELINAMPEALGRQFQGEWAIYSLSMLTQALVNISYLYPETQEENALYIDSLITIALAPEIRYYDKLRWYYEDPLESLEGNNSHISYISHLAWMIGNYKKMSSDHRYDELYHNICATMNRRILNSPNLNLPTYPREPIYVPDMMVAIVALANYARQNGGLYQSTVDQWLTKAQTEWLDKQTELLPSYMDSEDCIFEYESPMSGLYVAVNCYYLTLIDEPFARSQYQLMKQHFLQLKPVTGIKEYCDERCLLGFNMDAGIILLNLTPSGTAFALGPITFFEDSALRSRFLLTAELAGHTVCKNNQRHYLLADFALVGEAVSLAMRTNVQQ